MKRVIGPLVWKSEKTETMQEYSCKPEYDLVHVARWKRSARTHDLYVSGKFLE